MDKQGFDNRIVSYEYIHSIKSKDRKALIDAINPESNETILDSFCGYGAVGKECLERENAIKLWLNDESRVQLERAKENLPKVPKNHFILGHFPDISFKNLFFDKIVIKMDLHEVPKKEQLRVSKKAFELLEDKGRFIIWDIMLNKENQTLFQDIIRKKDELSGFDILMKERYFFREEEFLQIMKKAGFSKIKEFHIISYRFSSKKRLEQELHNDKSQLNKLNEFIRKRFPEKLRKKLGYEDFGEDIQFNVTKKIYIMQK